ncbi:hypothetical protein ATN38_02080 [Rhodococcus sp. FH8]|jgi:hypothetical protein|nr:hypothetical protein [Rhodococcus sp. FH8]
MLPVEGVNIEVFDPVLSIQVVEGSALTQGNQKEMAAKWPEMRLPSKEIVLVKQCHPREAFEVFDLNWRCRSLRRQIPCHHKSILGEV